MSKPWATFLIFTFLSMETAFAQPPVRKFDDPGSPPFKVLQTGENPPLGVDGNYVIGPEYTPAPERKAACLLAKPVVSAASVQEGTSA